MVLVADLLLIAVVVIDRTLRPDSKTTDQMRYHRFGP